MQSVPINFENNFVCAKQSMGRRGGGEGGWTNGRGGKREKGWKGKQFRPEISIKAKRRKSAPPVTVNFSSGLHLTAA